MFLLKHLSFGGQTIPDFSLKERVYNKKWRNLLEKCLGHKREKMDLGSRIEICEKEVKRERESNRKRERVKDRAREKA